jgi:hypothetical protein
MEPKDDDNIVAEYIPNEIAFTRYLYPKLYVKQSLMIALLEHQYDETLFWTYELYFSGFEDETYDFVFKIYNDLYRYDNPKFINFMQITRFYWYKNTLQYWLIGSIVATLCLRNYRLDKFVENYFNIRCCPSSVKTNKKTNLIIRLNEQNIREYKINRYVHPPRKYLSLVCKYGVRNNVNRLFMNDATDLQEKWYRNWEYYACLSPLWRERLDDFNGRVNIEVEKVEFEDEESEEAFYERWNLEPDEQPPYIQQFILGKKDEVQMNIREFCEKYGCKLVTKTIKMKK